MNAVQTTTNSLSILSDIIASLSIADEYTAKDEIYAAHTANQQVENGKPFRDAYHDVKQSQTYETNTSTKKPNCQSHKNLKATWQQEQKRFNNMVQSLRSNYEETA